MKKSNILWGLLLILVGVSWILSSTNMVQIDLIGSLFTLWPIFIIAAGISIFLSKGAHIMRIIVWVLVFAIIAGYGIYLGYSNGGIDLHDGGNTFEMRDNIKKAKLHVNVGAADFRIGSTDSDLAVVNSNIKDLKYNYSGGESTDITYSQKVKFYNAQGGKIFTADLNKSIPWDVDLNSGATEGTVDFSDIMLSSCDINTGACDLKIIAGDRQQESKIQINGGAVNVKITIPAGSAIKIQSNAAVSNVRGDGIEIIKDGRNHYSENADSAEKIINLVVNSGVSEITVNVMQ